MTPPSQICPHIQTLTGPAVCPRSPLEQRQIDMEGDRHSSKENPSNWAPTPCKYSVSLDWFGCSMPILPKDVSLFLSSCIKVFLSHHFRERVRALN
jgi:hypothetical protein